MQEHIEQLMDSYEANRIRRVIAQLKQKVWNKWPEDLEDQKRQNEQPYAVKNRL